ncbi:MAG: acyclic terpene utilization AtuA family protein [Bacillota bacterium]
MEQFKVLAPTAILGYGFPEKSFQAGLAEKPDAIAVDGGSTDPGPYYLGSGRSFTDREAVKRDLRFIIRGGQKLSVPVLVGTAGGSGADSHLNWTAKIVEELADEEGWDLQVSLISAQFEPDYVANKLAEGQLEPLAPAEEIGIGDIKEAANIVGQMGVEPIVAALEDEPDVILCGRAYDPTVFAAPAIKAGFKPGLALHMGKILECASIAADPGSGSDCMLGTLTEDSFILKPLNPNRRCTVTSVAAHTLYEKADPYHLVGPGGEIDLTETEFTAISDREVEVSGSKFKEDEQYTIKLEGASLVGYRTISIAGARDPIMISQLDSILVDIRAMVADNFTELTGADYDLIFKQYGRDGVMGELEPKRNYPPHYEIGLIIEAIARTQELADTICSFARSSLLHYGYEGRKATAGNLAFPYSPSDFHGGEVYRFSLHHLIKVDNPIEPFAIEKVRYRGGR